MKNKTICLGIVFIILTGIFALAIVSAEEMEVENIDEILPAVEMSSADLAFASPENYQKTGFARATYGRGFAVSGEAGYFADILWATHVFSKINKEDIELIKEKHKGNPAALKKALENEEKSIVIRKTAGKLQIGTGSQRENFKLNLTFISANNKTVSFDVLSINSQGEEGRAKAGNLTLNAAVYPELTIWRGKLNIESGTKAGIYNITLASKTAFVKNIDKGSSAGKGRKLGFFQRLFGRNK